MSESVVIRPSRGWFDLGLGELWTHRELLYYLVWREIKVRYKQTVIGAAWAVVQPLGMMLIFTVVFGKLLGVRTGEIPYPVFALAALVPWYYFAHAVQSATTGIVEQKEVITRVYFPRLLLPLASVTAPLVDAAISMVALAAVMAWFGIAPAASIAWLPLFALLAAATALAIGLWLSALNAVYRDVRFLVPFGLQALMFASPVVYPSGVIKNPTWQALYGLNPMAGVIEGFRWSLLGSGEPPGGTIWVSAAAVVVLLFGGLVFFRRMEGVVADVV